MKIKHFCGLASARVNQAEGTINDVSVITANVECIGHEMFTDATTLAQVKASADSGNGVVQVKADHGSGFSGIVGALKNFRIVGDKLLADLSLIKTHAHFQAILEIIGTLSSTVGLSVAFTCAVEPIGGKNFARCLKLWSVDLVDSPAANPGGLFAALSAVQNKNMNTQNLMSREDWNALKPAAQSEFFKNGGRLFDGPAKPKQASVGTMTAAQFTAATEPTMTRAEFSKLSPRSQLKFSQEGGKIID